MNEIVTNVRQQLIPSSTGKRQITAEDLSLFALPQQMGRIEFRSNTYSGKYELSRAICDPSGNSDQEITETEQTLMKKIMKIERQITTLSKNVKILENCSAE